MVLLSGILIILPLSYPRLFFLGWFALVPFLLSIRRNNQGLAFRKGWLLGITIIGGTSYWLIYPLADFSGLSIPFSIALLVIFVFLFAITYGIWSWLFVRVNNRQTFSVLWLAISWTGFEYLRYLILPDFPFGFIGYTQGNFSFLLQLADLGGLFLISFILVLINGYVFKSLLKRKLRKLVPVVLILLLVTVYGIFRLDQYNDKEYDYLKAGIVQTNITPADKWKPDNIIPNLNNLLGNTGQFEGVELIIWPESSLTFDLVRNQYYREIFLNGLSEVDAYVQSGSLAIGRGEEGDRKYNSSFLISPEGKVIKRYDKMRLVPFGEYMPFNNLVEIVTGIRMASEIPGKELVLMEILSAQWRTVICSEILQPHLVRRGIADSDFIVNQSNEAWYYNGNLQQQIWTASIFRAVENRRAVIRAGNYAYGGVITPAGKVDFKLEPGQANSSVVKIKKNRDKTFYQQWGDFAGYGMLIISGLVSIVNLILRKRKKY